MTNVDHHVQAIRRALRPLPGAKADWEILMALARHLGKPWSYHSPRDILLEIADSNPFYAGLTWEDLGEQGVRTQEQEVAMLSFLNNIIVASIIKSAIIIFALLTAFAYMTLIERRVVARLQGRLGPNRAGPGGMFQPVADAIKMAFKEQIIPTQARKPIYLLAPIISVVVALCAFAVVPIGNSWITGKPSVWDPWIGDINVGLLWILSISSLAVYGIVLGGWSSG